MLFSSSFTCIFGAFRVICFFFSSMMIISIRAQLRCDVLVHGSPIHRLVIQSMKKCLRRGGGVCSEIIGARQDVGGQLGTSRELRESVVEHGKVRMIINLMLAKVRDLIWRINVWHEGDLIFLPIR